MAVENMRRRQSRRLHGIESPNAKLIDEQVIEMRRRYDALEYGSFQKLSDEFGVSAIVVRSICMQRSWRHLTPHRNPVKPKRYPNAVSPEMRRTICSLYVTDNKNMTQIHEITSVALGTISKIINEEGCKVGYDKRTINSGHFRKLDHAHCKVRIKA